MRKLVLVSAIVGSLVAASNAQADITTALGISCSAVGDQRQCGNTSPRSTSPSWDGTPIDVNLAFPDASAGDGPFPLIIWGHGYGGSKLSFADMERFTDRGYAVFSMTDRGFHESCGSTASVGAGGSACDNGYIHLMDDRYEIRDAQFFAGELADEGVADGQRVGAVGGSYGGGLSLQLATLKDRVMMPDGSLVPWTSPVNGISMRIAGGGTGHPMERPGLLAHPERAASSTTSPTRPTPAGWGSRRSRSTTVCTRPSRWVPASTAVEAPFPSPCNDFAADVTAWKTRIEQGEPYDGDPAAQAILDEIKAHHSAYYIDQSESPAPTLISNGFVDDLFPADEAIG